ncbi:hypothetical protein ACIQAC_10065 [Streptomyces sp. NPDC088387]|uniref:hypothetical protein n=1 Tax=Streptomyces sp. NPDC088387 TaxID=3365859 RepID=UPI0038028A2D
MTANVPDRPASADPPRPPHRYGARSADADPRRHRQGPSPERGEFLRALNRRQIEDRTRELGELYTRTSPGEPWATETERAVAFLRRLAGDMRRPGFELVVAETAGPGGTAVITGCAYGFLVTGEGPWWQGLDEYLPDGLRRLAAAGRLFAVGDILVERRVRTQDQGRDWNLARRLQGRLLADHVDTLGVTLVDRGDTDAVAALLAWGWQRVPGEVTGPSATDHGRLLVLR